MFSFSQLEETINTLNVDIKNKNDELNVRYTSISLLNDKVTDYEIQISHLEKIEEVFLHSIMQVGHTPGGKRFFDCQSDRL